MNGNLIFKLCLLLLLGTVLGFGSNVIRTPDQGRIPWVTNWSESIESQALKLGLQLADLAEVDTWARDGSHLILDARPPEDYQAGHIPGAMSLPYNLLNDRFPEIQMFLAPELPVVCYCSGETCEDSLLLGEFLIQQGYTSIYLFEGGMKAWRDVGYLEEGQ